MSRSEDAFQGPRAPEFTAGRGKVGRKEDTDGTSGFNSPLIIARLLIIVTVLSAFLLPGIAQAVTIDTDLSFVTSNENMWGTQSSGVTRSFTYTLMDEHFPDQSIGAIETITIINPLWETWNAAVQTCMSFGFSQTECFSGGDMTVPNPAWLTWMAAYESCTALGFPGTDCINGGVSIPNPLWSTWNACMDTCRAISVVNFTDAQCQNGITITGPNPAWDIWNTCKNTINFLCGSEPSQTITLGSTPGCGSAPAQNFSTGPGLGAEPAPNLSVYVGPEPVPQSFAVEDGARVDITNALLKGGFQGALNIANGSVGSTYTTRARIVMDDVATPGELVRVSTVKDAGATVSPTLETDLTVIEAKMSSFMRSSGKVHFRAISVGNELLDVDMVDFDTGLLTQDIAELRIGGTGDNLEMKLFGEEIFSTHVSGIGSNILLPGLIPPPYNSLLGFPMADVAIYLPDLATPPGSAVDPTNLEKVNNSQLPVERSSVCTIGECKEGTRIDIGKFDIDFDVATVMAGYFTGGVMLPLGLTVSPLGFPMAANVELNVEDWDAGTFFSLAQDMSLTVNGVDIDFNFSQPVGIQISPGVFSNPTSVHTIKLGEEFVYRHPGGTLTVTSNFRLDNSFYNETTLYLQPTQTTTFLQLKLSGFLFPADTLMDWSAYKGALPLSAEPIPIDTVFKGTYALPGFNAVAGQDFVINTQCSPGTYQDLSGEISCKDAELGKYVSGFGAYASTDCLAGTYQDTTGQASCKQAPVGSYTDAGAATSPTLCLPGTYQAEPGQTSCLDCQEGEYQDETGQAVCKLATTGTYVDTTAATSLSPCLAGTYQDQVGQNACIVAPAGTYAPSTGTIAIDCPVGSFQEFAGQTSCDLAPAGTFVNTTGATGATDCATGFYQDTQGQASCKPSPVGTYVGSTGAASPSPCLPGSYQDATGQFSCIDAPAGSYVAVTGATASILCPLGTYQDLTGQASCNDAPVGYYVDITGAIGPIICTAGTYQDSTGQTACIEAPLGSYVGAVGAITATQCPVDSYQDQVDQTSCLTCPAGTAQPLIGQTSCSSDKDGDGIPDASDGCPLDPNNDIDDDGVCGDVDAFPTDPAASVDGDGDGDPDTWNQGKTASNSTTSLVLDLDDDNDGVPDIDDICAGFDDTLDADTDGTPDSCDAFANDPTEKTDTDNDGQGDNTDTDDDSDGILDVDDAFPLDATPIPNGISLPPTDGDNSGIKRKDKGDKYSNKDKDNGKPRSDIEYLFEIVIKDTSGNSPPQVRLVVNGQATDMTLEAGNFTDGALYSLALKLGPAEVYNFNYEALDDSGNVVYTYPDSSGLPGPVVELLNGPNMVGLAKDMTNSGLGLLDLFATNSVFQWISDGVTTDTNNGSFEALDNTNSHLPGRGYFILREFNATLPSLSIYPETATSTTAVDLSPGWNIISNPYSSHLKLSDIQVQRGSDLAVTWAEACTNRWVTNSIYSYLGSDWGSSYTFESAGGDPEATLTPWIGYWIYVIRNDANYKLIFNKP